MQLSKSPNRYEYGRFYIEPAGLDKQDELASAYIRMKQEGLLPVVFHQSIPDLSTFLVRYLAVNSTTMLCYYIDTKGMTHFVGVGHVTAPALIVGPHLKAECSMVFFCEWQRRSTTVPLAHLMLEYSFDRRFGDQFLTTILGCTPEKNKLAVRFIAAVGFVRAKEPMTDYTAWNGELCGAYSSWMTRKRWELTSPFREG